MADDDRPTHFDDFDGERAVARNRRDYARLAAESEYLQHSLDRSPDYYARLLRWRADADQLDARLHDTQERLEREDREGESWKDGRADEDSE